MILNYASSTTSSNEVSISGWLAKLQEGKKSTQQLQSELLESTTENIKALQEKALENAKEALQEKAKESSKEISTSSGSSSESVQTTTEKTSAASDDIKAPSEVTKADLESPIDIKL